MEERAIGGKEKKYVLYTVVNDDRARTGFGVWAVRILLGSLLLVALAVVPYVSLRLAQVNDRTLVVFQPFPIHNHSRNHHHKATSSRPRTAAMTHIIQSASLVKENFTTEASKRKKGYNATIITLHESAVTLSLLEDTNNTTRITQNQTADTAALSASGTSQGEAEDMVVVDEIAVNLTTSLPSRDLRPQAEEVAKKEILEVKVATTKASKVNGTSEDLTSPANTVKDDPIVTNPTLISVSASPEERKESSTAAFSETSHQEETSKQIKPIKPTIISILTTTSTLSTTSRPIPKFSSPRSGRIIHKLAYVATATSGNHGGGICVWRTNKTVTEWSYFYDNIPIEYQSHQDTADHEMRTLLAAVRLWANDWHDYHVVLRSQHPSIKGSKHPTRVELEKELDGLSQDHFTYELEWRQRRDDNLMNIAFALSRLHKNFNYWFDEFEHHVDEVLGPQDWEVRKTDKRREIPKKLFETAQKPQRGDGEIGDLTSFGLF